MRPGVGEAMADIAIGMDLPVGAAVGKLLAECDHRVGWNHRILPAVVGNDFRLDWMGWQAGRVKQAVEAGHPHHVRTGTSDIESTLSAETIADHRDFAV